MRRNFIVALCEGGGVKRQLYMCCNILPHSEEIVGKHRKDIWHFIRVCLKIRDIAHYKGLDPLMQAAEALSKRIAI